MAKDAEIFGITAKRKVGSGVALVRGNKRDGEILLAIIGALLLRGSGAQIKLEDDVPSHGRINVEIVDKTLRVVDLESGSADPCLWLIDQDPDLDPD